MRRARSVSLISKLELALALALGEAAGAGGCAAAFSEGEDMRVVVRSGARVSGIRTLTPISLEIGAMKEWTFEKQFAATQDCRRFARHVPLYKEPASTSSILVGRLNIIADLAMSVSLYPYLSAYSARSHLSQVQPRRLKPREVQLTWLGEANSTAGPPD